jgi:hypothetical protein
VGVLQQWGVHQFHFAALPTAAQLFVPFALLPVPLGAIVFMTINVVAWLACRRLGLAWWWLLFPPVFDGLVSGNPQILVFAPLIVGGPVARAIAVALKVYALVPIVARKEWRAIAVSAAFLAASANIGWQLLGTHLREYGQTSARIISESGGGLSATMELDPKRSGGVLFFALAVVLLLAATWRNVQAAGWLAVPILGRQPNTTSRP